MGIQILPEGQGGFAQSFGQSLGQGVAQQLPEEIKRYRLKSGLENLSQQNISDPYQLLSQLATIPGMDPGLLGILAPSLQGQIGRQQAGASFDPSFQNSNEQRSPSAVSNVPSPIAGQQPSQQVSKPEPLNQLAVNLLRSQPSNYPNIQVATAEAERRIGNVESELNKQFESYLQKGKTLQEGEIGGDVRDLMRQKAIQDLATTGHSERSIANKYASLGKEIAKEYGSLRKVHSDVGAINKPTEFTIDSIRKINGRLEDLGVPQDQIIDNNVSSLNVDKSAASYLFNPLTDTKAGKFLHKLKPKPSLIENIFGGVKEKSTGFGGKNFDSAEAKIAKEIAPLIIQDGSKDIIGSIAYIAKQKGYDARVLLGELSNILPKDKITTEQARDLGNQGLVSKIPSLSQGWLMGWSGEKKKAGKVR